jgi:hypothetical protein
MQLSISRKTGNNNSEEFLFQSEMTDSSCSNAKQIALDTDVGFEMQLPGQENPRLATLNSMIDLLKPDEETEKLFRICYTPANMIGSDKIAVSYLSITCSGRVKLSIPFPEMNGGLVWGSNSGNVKIGLGLSFQAGIRLLKDDMKCPGEIPV